MSKAKTKVEEPKKVVGSSKGSGGGKTEYLKDICMKYSDVRNKRILAVSKANKVVQKF